MEFRHYTDRAVTLAVDLVNTRQAVTGEEELGHEEALASFAAAHGLAGEPSSAAELADVRVLRDRLRDVFGACGEKEAAGLINSLLEDVGAAPRVVAHDGSPTHFHFEPAGSGIVRRLGTTAVMGLAVVLCNYGSKRLGLCASPMCRSAFVDASKNARKRYCSETCATRENVAAYRARLRQAR